MNILFSKIDASEYIQSLPDLLIHEISKPEKPFEFEKPNSKVHLKYKDPNVRIIKRYYFMVFINNTYRK